jgi:hypothetical protein
MALESCGGEVEAAVGSYLNDERQSFMKKLPLL